MPVTLKVASSAQNMILYTSTQRFILLSHGQNKILVSCDKDVISVK
jgi:hypothetical protein